MDQSENNTSAYIALLAASFLWASSFVALKIAFRGYDPMVVIFGRMFTASLCFIPYLKGFSKLPYRKGDWKILLFMALCEPGLYFVFEALALERTTASQAGMIVALLPLMVAVGAVFFLKETLTRRTLTGFLLAIAGAVWLSLEAEAEQSAPNPLLGNFFEFIAMVCATGYMLIAKGLSGRYPPLFITATQAFVGSFFFAPLLFLPTTVPPTHFDPVPFGAIIYLGVFVTLAAYGSYNYGISKIPAGQAAAFANLIPVITVVLGAVFLGERFNVPQYFAAALVLAGVFLSQDRPKKTEVAPE